MSWEVAYAVTLYLSIALYLATLVACVLQLVRVFRHGAPGWTLSKIIHCLMPLALLSRLLDMTFYYFLGEPEMAILEQGGGITAQPPILIILGGIPGYLFFSTYILLVLFWILVFYHAHKHDMAFVGTIKRIYMFINCLVYIIYGAFCILFFTSPEHELREYIHPAEAIYASFLAFGAAIVFLVFGIRIRKKLQRLSMIGSLRRISIKVGLLTILCTVIFTIRSIIILLSIFVLFDRMGVLVARMAFTIGCEVLPTWLILLILGAQIVGTSVHIQRTQTPTRQNTHAARLIVAQADRVETPRSVVLADETDPIMPHVRAEMGHVSLHDSRGRYEDDDLEEQENGALGQKRDTVLPHTSTAVAT